MITIERIDAGSPLLDRVIALHRSEGKNLGMFPKGAFLEHANSRWILVAHDDKGGCLGYLLYREARGRAMIAHLCVRQESRSKGIGRALVERLKADTKHLRGIGLYCRRDYGARAAWPRYGFAPVSAKRGRGSDGGELEFWWLDHNHADLFSLAAAKQPQARLRVVIDANVFYDLYERNTPDSEDSKALLADWLQEEIQLLLTREIHVEVSRAPTDAQRQRSAALISRHEVLKTEDAKFQELVGSIQSCFPDSACLRDDSDIRQVAHTIAGGVAFFVTRDEKLIERAEPLAANHGLRVLHPTALINEIDSLRREAEYRPVRLEGSRLTSNLLRDSQVGSVVDALRHAPQERVSEFEKVLRHFLAKPQEYECVVTLAGDKKPIALLTKTPRPPSCLEIPLFRLSDDSLAPTVGRHILRSLIEVSSSRFPILNVTDQNLGESAKAAMLELGFVPSEQGWSKVTFSGVAGVGSIKQTLQGLSLPEPTSRTLAGALDAYQKNPGPLAAADLERVFWPAKLANGDIPSFVVPIQAQWAEHFFDSDLASERLFGVNEQLHLGIEGAYYCSSRNTLLQQPGRVLWYVSKGSEGRGSMTVKACSRIEEVLLGTPKGLFKKLSRLGVYQWNDVLRASGGELTQPLLAFRFSMTERFTKPLDLQMLNSLGVPSPIMSPRRITVEQFENIYTLGKCLKR